MRAQFFEDAVLGAFIKEIQILLANGRKKAIGIVELPDLGVGFLPTSWRMGKYRPSQ